jgi:hypothetical protein
MPDYRLPKILFNYRSPGRRFEKPMSVIVVKSVYRRNWSNEPKPSTEEEIFVEIKWNRFHRENNGKLRSDTLGKSILPFNFAIFHWPTSVALSFRLLQMEISQREISVF